MSFQASELSRSIQTKLEQLAQVVEEQRASEDFQNYLDMMARFHRYSWGNCWLIAMQRPSASMVAGFTQWKRLGRRVRAGEKAIRIMAPCPVLREDPNTGGEEERLFFKTACVWDRLSRDFNCLLFPTPQTGGGNFFLFGSFSFL